MNVSIQLKEWAKIYLKNRDMFQKSIKKFGDLNGDFIVHKSIGNILFLIRPELKSVEELVDKDGGVSLVVLNTKKNVFAVVANWDLLSSKKDLCIFFVNLKFNEKWLLFPFTHNQIIEKSSLKRGLMSLFSSIQTVE